MPGHPGSLRRRTYPCVVETVNRIEGRRGPPGRDVSAPESTESLAEKLRRWRTVNHADSRADDGPAGRVYTVPFATVWDELLGMISRRRRWRLKHSDEELGIISVSCVSPVFRFVDDLTIWVALDPDGLTRVEALSRSRKGTGDLGVNARRIERLFDRLDQRVGPANRLVDRGIDRPRAAGAPGARRASDKGATFA